MLYFIFTVDGDWGEYFDVELTDEKRLPKKDLLLDLLQHEIDLADRVLKGRFVHFIHTSPRVRDFFLEKDFRKLWKDIVKNNGDTGLHCHEDDPYKVYYHQDSSRMKKVIAERCAAFRKAGLSVECYRSGFLGFSTPMVRILEENKIYFDFSCEPGRLLKHEDQLICDWRGAPESQYRMSYEDHCKKGDSKVWEIPMGASGNKYLYFEKSSSKELDKIAFDLKARSVDNKGNIVVSVLSHTYDYGSSAGRKDIEDKLSLLKQHGRFINLIELKKLIS